MFKRFAITYLPTSKNAGKLNCQFGRRKFCLAWNAWNGLVWCARVSRLVYSLLPLILDVRLSNLHKKKDLCVRRTQRSTRKRVLFTAPPMVFTPFSCCSRLGLSNPPRQFRLTGSTFEPGCYQPHIKCTIEIHPGKIPVRWFLKKNL